MDRKIVLSEKDIQKITKKLGKKISKTLSKYDKIPLIVGVMKGSLNFMMDLLKHIEIPILTDYIQISSYCGTSSTGHVQLVKDLSYNCEDRVVVIVEDIVDTGKSMDYLIKHIKGHHPKKVYVCSLFDKKPARKVNVKVDFVGKELTDNGFLIGYGLDYNEIERNVPYVYDASKEDIEKLDEILKRL